MKYLIEITETLQRTILVEAETNDEAIERVESAYRSENIVLDSDDFVDNSINSIGTVNAGEDCSGYWNLDELVEKGGR